MSLDFEPVSLSRRSEYLERFFSVSQSGCECVFGNLFTWAHGFDTALAFSGDSVTVRTGTSKFAYSIPFGTEKITDVIDELEPSDGQLKFFCLTHSARDALDCAYPGRFVFEPVRSSFDYVYLREELATLPGRRFHKKKNHFAAFSKTYVYTYEPIGNNNIEECLAFSEAWSDENLPRIGNPVEVERQAIRKAFAHYNELEYTGALIRVDGKIVAYCAGERMSGDMFCTHFEKALPEYVGSYAAINKLFAQNALGDYKYINREEDTGDEGLRQAKLSYQPAFLTEKYNATEK